MLVDDGVVFPNVALNSCILVDEVKWVFIEPLAYLSFVLAPVPIFLCILAVEKTYAWNIVEPIQPVARHSDLISRITFEAERLSIALDHCIRDKLLKVFARTNLKIIVIVEAIPILPLDSSQANIRVVENVKLASIENFAAREPESEIHAVVETAQSDIHFSHLVSGVLQLLGLKIIVITSFKQGLYSIDEIDA